MFFSFHPDPWGFMIQFEEIFFRWVGSTTEPPTSECSPSQKLKPLIGSTSWSIEVSKHIAGAKQKLRLLNNTLNMWFFFFGILLASIFSQPTYLIHPKILWQNRVARFYRSTSRKVMWSSTRGVREVSPWHAAFLSPENWHDNGNKRIWRCICN